MLVRLQVKALQNLLRAATAEKHAGYAHFAQNLILHAQMEEEVLYPASILVGFTVIEVSSADEAMRILEAAVNVDLVFADVNLEGSSLDGFGLSRWVRDNKPGIKVLLTSGVVPAPDDETVLPKPYKYDELVRRIRALLASYR